MAAEVLQLPAGGVLALWKAIQSAAFRAPPAMPEALMARNATASQTSRSSCTMPAGSTAPQRAQDERLAPN